MDFQEEILKLFWQQLVCGEKLIILQVLILALTFLVFLS